jgi:hypothetical protein
VTTESIVQRHMALTLTADERMGWVWSDAFATTGIEQRTLGAPRRS